jgi:hypothetical protein
MQRLDVYVNIHRRVASTDWEHPCGMVRHACETHGICGLFADFPIMVESKCNLALGSKSCN